MKTTQPFLSSLKFQVSVILFFNVYFPQKAQCACSVIFIFNSEFKLQGNHSLLELTTGVFGICDDLNSFFFFESHPSEQPNHAEEENCAVIRTESSGRWQNRDCSVALPYVCKKRPNATLDPFTTGQCQGYHSLPKLDSKLNKNVAQGKNLNELKPYCDTTKHKKNKKYTGNVFILSLCQTTSMKKDDDDEIVHMCIEQCLHN